MVRVGQHEEDGVAADQVAAAGAPEGRGVWSDGNTLYHRAGFDLLRVEPWGANSVRVRAYRDKPASDVGALTDPPQSSGDAERRADGSGRLVVGELTVELDADGLLRFVRTSDSGELLAEQPIHYWWPGPRNFVHDANGYFRIEQQFRAYPGERLYGLGQHQHGRLDQKGVVIDLVQRNAEVSIPFLVSSRGYGLLWNNPAVGRVELGETATRWVADSAQLIDYWVTAGTPAQIAGQYADATGHAPQLPDWAAGFWQSKLRYRTQEELLAVAREYHERGLPLAVIVCDYFHWPHQGDWCFERSEWPDPAAMIAELERLGTKLMVSVWPSVSNLSENYAEMLDQGLLMANEQGSPYHGEFPDRGTSVAPPVSFYDPTNPRARAYLWRKLYENYYKLGVRVFWLDACEPEFRPAHPRNLRLYAGPGTAVANRYPLDHARMVHEGLTEHGEDVLTLCRSAWAGSQRFGAAVWSGDIGVTFETLRAQISAGLNIGLSGIPWWTTDIGGFHGGEPSDPGYRELVIRWFQYGVWCPLFRLHGHREPRPSVPARSVEGISQASFTGGANEAWSFGDEAYAIISRLLGLRAHLRPYILEQMGAASEFGIPPMRPLWFDFPQDPRAWTVEDQFLFGPEVIVAPVTDAGARSRSVYLPAGAPWRNAVTGELLAGGEEHFVAAPLEWIPVFVRGGSDLSFGELLQ